MRRESFERFYYEKVGLGECCGCAEHVTRLRDLDALAARIAATSNERSFSVRPLSWVRRLLAGAARAGRSWQVPMPEQAGAELPPRTGSDPVIPVDVAPVR